MKKLGQVGDDWRMLIRFLFFGKTKDQTSKHTVFSEKFFFENFPVSNFASSCVSFSACHSAASTAMDRPALAFGNALKARRVSNFQKSQAAGSASLINTGLDFLSNCFHRSDYVGNLNQQHKS